jgi:putative endonuclease
MLYRVYITQSTAGRFYIGLADDVARRLNDHNSGASTWTRHKGPWVLRWTSEAMSLSEARKLENRQKSRPIRVGGDLSPMVRLSELYFSAFQRFSLPLPALAIPVGSG